MADALPTPTSITKSVSIKMDVFAMNFCGLITASSPSSTGISSRHMRRAPSPYQASRAYGIGQLQQRLLSPLPPCRECCTESRSGSIGEIRSNLKVGLRGDLGGVCESSNNFILKVPRKTVCDAHHMPQFFPVPDPVTMGFKPTSFLSVPLNPDRMISFAERIGIARSDCEARVPCDNRTAD